MVFFSALHFYLGNSFLGSPSRRRLVFSFGRRALTVRMLLEEAVMGLTLTLPLALLFAFLLQRFVMAGWRPSWFKKRSEWWTTILITVAGDFLLELTIPSLQCLPTYSEELSFFKRIQRTWGYNCPSIMTDLENLAFLLEIHPSTEAASVLLAVRLLFMISGVFIGESIAIPVALTGGIACGKSTVARMLVEEAGTASERNSQGSSNNSSSNDKLHQRQPKKGKKKPKWAQQKEQELQSNSDPSSSFTPTPSTTKSLLSRLCAPFSSLANIMLSKEDEYRFLMIDTDQIGHEILLPPAVLAGDLSVPTTTNKKDDNATTTQTLLKTHSYSTSPTDSVYHAILQAFGDPTRDFKNILEDGDNNICIDRNKLGAIVFENPHQRRVLNKITHPRIILILLKRLLRGVFLDSSVDVICAEVPLLFESGALRWLFGLTIVLACKDPAKQLQRLQQRNPNLTPQQCRDRINSQFPMKTKVQMADLVIWNDSDNLEDLQTRVDEVKREIHGRLFGLGMSLTSILLLVGFSFHLHFIYNFFGKWFF